MRTLLLLTLTLFTTLTQIPAQETHIDMHGGKIAKKSDLSYGKVLDIKAVKRYKYLKIDENGQIFWIAIATAEVAKGDNIGFDKETLMTNFKSETLGKTFDKIYFVSELSLPKKQNLTMKEMLNLSTEGK